MKKKNLQTTLIHTGDNAMAKNAAASVSVPKVLPIHMTSVYSFDDVESLDAVYAGEQRGYVYSRMANPTTDNVEEMLAAAEGADGALVFSSGMAAIINTVITYVQAGDHIVSSPVLYGGVWDFFKNELPRFGIEVTFTDFANPTDVEAAIKPNTKLIYTETISNPVMEVVNLPAVAKVAHAHGARLIVDNTFATAAVARPMDMGADIVVYSATKYLGGHSDIIGGAVIAKTEDIQRISRYFTLYGACMGPMEAWLLARSLRTLEMRMKTHSENAQKVAEFLEQHPKVEKVHFPGLKSSPSHEMAMKLFIDARCSGMLSADIAGGERGAQDLIRNCKTIKFVPSLASYSTTISYPAKTSHRAYSKEAMADAGITMGTLRFSIGLEHPEDIIEELDEALLRI